jgi:hypothetical protein
VEGICRQLEEAVQRYNSKLNSMCAQEARRYTGNARKTVERKFSNTEIKHQTQTEEANLTRGKVVWNKEEGDR